MRERLLTLGLALTTLVAAGTPASVFAPEGERIAAFVVQVVPDRLDWTYAPGEAVSFTVSVTADGEPVSGLLLKCSIGPEARPADSRKVPLEGDAVTLEGGTMNEPGFLRCEVETEVGGRTVRGMATVAFAPEAIEPTQVDPADFDAYWNAAKAELAAIPLEPTLELLPEASTGDLNVYHVSFRNWARTASSQYPGRLYGILCEPKAPGHYPAVLRVPAAGVRSYAGERALAARGMITLEIGIHGIPVNQRPEIYDQLRTAALDGYALYNLDDPQTYYFRRVHLGCVRAVDFLASRANWNGDDLVVFGASQGGMLAIATGALDERVTAVATMMPAYCDVTGYLHGRAGGWPHMMRSAEAGHATSVKLHTASLFDTVNFARRLRVPVLFAFGYNDKNCGPTSVYSAYNVVTAPKQLALALEVGHTITPEMDARVRRWIGKQIGGNPAAGFLTADGAD